MKFETTIAFSSLAAFAAACSGDGNNQGASSGATAGATAGTGGATSGGSGSNDGAAQTGSAGSGAGAGSGGLGGAGPSSGNSGPGGAGATGDAGGGVSGSSGSASGGSSTTLACGNAACDAPNSCCQSAGAAPVCGGECAADQMQLCAVTADCQAGGSGICANGFCDYSADAGVSDVGASDGAVYMAGQGGNVPPGYPQPTAANAAQCQTTTMLVGGLCPGGGAGPVCIECLFGGPMYNDTATPTAQAIAEAGNYLVTVELGGSAAGQTFVAAESSRGLLAPVTTPAGGSAEYAFVVNVRPNEGQPNHPVGGAGGYPGLDLFFSGPTATPPQILGIGYALATPATKPVMVYIASDSTACDQTGNLFGGWGQMLTEYFAPPLGIANYANSGAGSTRFPYWADIKAKWTPGDWALIQFGHNDGNLSDATVQANLEGYVSDALAAHVTPIVISPPARVKFVGNVDGGQGSLHAAAAKAAAAAKNVAYIDLTTLSTAWYNSLGSQAAAMKYHEGGTDKTHTNLEGAYKIAGLIAGAMKTQNIPLSKYLR